MNYEIPEKHIEKRENEAKEVKERFYKTAPVEVIKKHLLSKIKRTHKTKDEKR